MAFNAKFHGINHADSIEELGCISNVPAGLRTIVYTAIDQLPNSEIEVEFHHDMNDGGVNASVTVKVLGPARPLPITLTRDQIVECRNRGIGIPKG